MRGAERVIHIQLGEGRELLRERRIVLLFLRVETHVLQQHDAAPAERVASTAVAPRRRCSPSQTPPAGRAVRVSIRGDRLKLYFGFTCPLGRPRCDARMTVAFFSSA